MAAVGKTVTITDGGYQATGLVIPHRRRESETGGAHAIRGVGRPRRSEGKSSRRPRQVNRR